MRLFTGRASLVATTIVRPRRDSLALEGAAGTAPRALRDRRLSAWDDNALRAARVRRDLKYRLLFPFGCRVNTSY